MVPAKSARPLHAVFLERVIKIEAVQAYRPAVTDDHTAQFFEEGHRPGAFGDFLWSLDRPEPFPSGPVAGAVFLWRPNPPATSEGALVSLPMQHAWDAAVAAWKAFIAALANGELIANGVHPGTGVRSELHPTEWARTRLVLDVHNGDLLEGWYSNNRQAYRAVVGHCVAGCQANPTEPTICANEGTLARV